MDLADRELVESFVEHIEVDPDTRTGVIILQADLQSVLASTRVFGGDSLTNDSRRPAGPRCTAPVSLARALAF